MASTLFTDTATVAVEEDGSFEVPAMPVGPLTLTGRDPEGRAVYATVGLERPGDVVHVVLELPRTQPPGLGTVVSDREHSDDHGPHFAATRRRPGGAKPGRVGLPPPGAVRS